MHGQHDQVEQALPAGTVIADRYRIDALLSQGGTSFVYRATDLSLGRAVGLKVMLHHLIGHAQRFENEARAMSALQHPAVVRIYGLGVLVDRRPYLAMEYVPGETLGARLDRMERMDPVDAARVIAPVCGALVEAHQQGICHRDIKPDNIMIQPMIGGRPAVRVLDFGIAGFDQPQGQRITRAGQIMGTPEYMAPEQAIGEEAGPAADVWALGVVLHHMLSGQPPFTGKDVPEVLYRLVNSPPAALPSGVPTRLAQVVTDCLKKQAAERPDAIEVLGRLESFQLGAEIEAEVNDRAVSELSTAEFRVDHLVPPKRRRGRWIGAALVGLLLGAGGAYAVLRSAMPGQAGPMAAPPVNDLQIAKRLIEENLGKAAGQWIEARKPDPMTPDWSLTAALARLNAGYLRPGIEAIGALLQAHPHLAQDPQVVPALSSVLRYKRGEGASALLTGPLWPAARPALQTQATEGVNSRARHRAIAALEKQGVAVADLRLQAWRVDLVDAKAACAVRKTAFDKLIEQVDVQSAQAISALDPAGKRCLGDALAAGLSRLRR